MTSVQIVQRRAVGLAQRIERDLCGRSWPVGTSCGSQDELRKRYRAGDDSLREAIRILEFNGVARMRSGPGGGLVVDRPPLSLVIASIVGFIRIRRRAEKNGTTLRDVQAARTSLAAVAVELACDRVADEKTRGGFVAWLQAELPQLKSADPMIALAEALADPCFYMAACCLHSLGRAIAVEEKVTAPAQPEEKRAVSRQLVGAILSGDRVSAVQALTLSFPIDWLGEPSPVPDPFLSYDSPLNRSRVGQLVRRIAGDVNSGALGEYSYVGSEAALSERYDVARATIRQALRVLEDARIVTARRGRKNGWFACAPTTELPFRHIGNYLTSFGVTPEHARHIASIWRRAADGVAPHPVLDLLLDGIEAFADGRSTQARQ